jgi:hypothetical protein
VLRPSRKCLAMGLLGWPIPLALPALVVLLGALLLHDWLFVAFSAACVVLVVWRVLQVKLIVGADSVTVFNPWGRTKVVVASSTRIGIDGTVAFAPVMTLGLGVFERGEHVVGIVASSYPSAASAEAWIPALRALAARTGCDIELPDTRTPGAWWR